MIPHDVSRDFYAYMADSGGEIESHSLVRRPNVEVLWKTTNEFKVGACCDVTETRCRKSEFVLAHPFVRTGKRSVRTKLWQRVLCGDGNGVAVCVARSYLFSFVCLFRGERDWRVYVII